VASCTGVKGRTASTIPAGHRAAYEIHARQPVGGPELSPSQPRQEYLRFVALAARVACPLVTFDKALLRAVPDIARRPRDL
jgi:hypothetical protein